MIVIFVTLFSIVPGIFCFPPCFDITHGECSGSQDTIHEVTVPDYESCRLICQDEYGAQCIFFIFELDSSSTNCKIFGKHFYDFVHLCNIIGGPKEDPGVCSYDNPSDNTCEVFRRGNCRYPETKTKIIQTKAWETCQSACKVLDCNYWKYKKDTDDCTLISSDAAMECEWKISPKFPSLEDCDDDIHTTPNPEDTTSKSPDHTTTNNPDHSTSSSIPTTSTIPPITTTTLPDPCYLPQSGRPNSDTAFHGYVGDVITISCEDISTNKEPCYIKNPLFLDEWITVDPKENFVLNCTGSLLPELKTLHDGSCGFEITHLEDRHDGVWTCGTMGQDKTAIDVKSTATVSVLDLCTFPESGSAWVDNFFKGKKGDVLTISCSRISTESRPCYMKNPNYNNDEWLKVDPSKDAVFGCDRSTTMPELTPLDDNSCGFEIGNLEDKHLGVWTCGVMSQDEVTIEVKSTASVCAQKTCKGPFAEVKDADICGCFTFNLTNSLSWNDARKFCQNEGGDLVTLESFDRNEIIFNHWDQYDISEWTNPWIGAHKQGGKWTWASTGATFPGEESDDPFANWDWGQPDEGDCVYMSKLGYGTWASQTCDYKGTFICEIK